MAIKTYQKGDPIKVAPNFRAQEFGCNGIGCCTEGKIDEKLVNILQQIRDHFGEPVYITSAYRCPKHNERVGGALGSYHTYGQAADIQVKDTTPAEVAKYAESIGVLGIGLYETFVHIDTRNTKSFWYGHQQEYRNTFGGAPEDKLCEVELKVLKRGASCEQVRVMQRLLNGRGYNCGSTDGIFGTATDAALRAFQKSQGISIDGECGAKTWAALLGV